MKHAKLWAMLAVLAILAPIGILVGLVFGLPPQYENTFLGALRDKYERLSMIREPKIVVIGGSSAAFGLDSAMMEEHTGMPVVNFGLYASLGTKLMLDLSRDHVGEGDIVIVAPETDAQTYSLYFNEESTWQALDGASEMLWHIDFENYGALLGGMWEFLQAKLAFLRSGEAPNPEGVYNRRNVNAYGDIAYARPYNRMAKGYDPTTVIDLTPEMADTAFLDYVNAYTADCRAAGAEVYFSFSPINRAALAEGTTEESLYTFFSYLTAKLDCEIITDIRDCVMDWEYFYDTNFHLNEAGVVHHTADLIGDIRRVQGNTGAYTIALPMKPQRPEVYVDESLNDQTGYFILEDVDGMMTLTGLTEAGKRQTTLVLPLAKDGLAVQGVAAGAFAGSAAETIHIGADTRLSLMENGAFAGAEQLTRIQVDVHPDTILVGGGLMDGASADARIYVKREFYGDFAAHYFWSEFMKGIVMGE